VLIADDEAPARRRLMRMLAEIGGVEIVGEASTGREVVRETERRCPDLLLLDIEMPELDGLDVARALSARCHVVFITAHQEHAIEAFDLEAVDYLLKPVTRERLAEALRRARVRRLAAAPENGAEMARVVTHTRGTKHLFDARRIAHFWAVDKYVAFHCEGEEHLTEESLSALEERLAPFGFVRVHRAHLVRRAAIRAITVQDRAVEARLQDGSAVPVSRRMVKRLKRELGL
jgi:DNA-binding LytR/AlgR family response regulator